MNQGAFLSSINRVNNLYFVDAKVNNFKLNFFREGGASLMSTSKRNANIQSATMKYLKDLAFSAEDVASGFVTLLNKQGGAGISSTTERKWSAELEKIIDDAVTV